MKFSQEQILTAMENTGIIHVFCQADSKPAKELLDATYSAGIRVFEFSNRETNALEVFEKLSVHAQQYKDLILGVGSIFSDEDAKKFLGLGADFIVSPALIPTVGVYCNSKQVLWIPGCGTITEIFNAMELGAQIINAFPGNVLGPSFVTAAKEVFPQSQLISSGWLEPTERVLEQWFSAGVTCIELDSQDFHYEGLPIPQIQEKIFQVLGLIGKIKLQ